MTRYTVKQLADMARISVRTLHHYDEIGLLKPAWLGDNGYRYYEQAQLYRLQQVLLYRDFGMGLEDIRILLDAPGFDTASALREHRARMVERLEQQQQLIGVIDDTLTRMKGDTTMQDENLYDWNSEAKRADYKQWLIERYSAQVDARMEADKKRRETLSDDERQAMEDSRIAIYRALIETYRQGVSADSETLTPLLQRHRDWLAFSWGRPCDPHTYKVTADVLAENPDYRQRLEAGAEGFAEWLRKAMKSHAEALLDSVTSL